MKQTDHMRWCAAFLVVSGLLFASVGPLAVTGHPALAVIDFTMMVVCYARALAHRDMWREAARERCRNGRNHREN